MTCVCDPTQYLRQHMPAESSSPMLVNTLLSDPGMTLATHNMPYHSQF